MSEIIYFNGKKYNGVAEMPLYERQMYSKLDQFMSDENKDGVPDVFQSGGISSIKETFNLIKDFATIRGKGGFDSKQISLVRVTDSGIFINGKEFASVTEMPDYIRNEYERIVNSARDGTEDIFEESWRQVDRSNYFEPHDDESFNQQFSIRPTNINQQIDTVDSTGRFLILAAVAILIIGTMAVVWFLYF